MEGDWTATSSEDAIISSKTCSYLRSAAKFAVENQLPLCLASAWSSKAKNDHITGRTAGRVFCSVCGLDLRNRRCFDLKLRVVDDTGTLEGLCCGCKQVYCCGEIELPSSSQSSIEPENVTDIYNELERTFDEAGISAMSTPLNKFKTRPMISPRVTAVQSQARRSRKRRSSTLERLLKEEDSETDRSLSGFLSMVSKQ